MHGCTAALDRTRPERQTLVDELLSSLSAAEIQHVEHSPKVGHYSILYFRGMFGGRHIRCNLLPHVVHRGWSIGDRQYEIAFENAH